MRGTPFTIIYLLMYLPVTLSLVDIYGVHSVGIKGLALCGIPFSSL